MLNEQLQKQIEQEADVTTARMNDRNDYEAGKIKGFEEGYIKAGERYAEKAQAAEARADRYEKALKEVHEKVCQDLPQNAEVGAISAQRCIEIDEYITDLFTSKTDNNG